jgi:hypothetical protein
VDVLSSPPSVGRRRAADLLAFDAPCSSRPRSSSTKYASARPLFPDGGDVSWRRRHPSASCPWGLAGIVDSEDASMCRLAVTAVPAQTLARAASLASWTVRYPCGGSPAPPSLGLLPVPAPLPEKLAAAAAPADPELVAAARPCPAGGRHARSRLPDLFLLVWSPVDREGVGREKKQGDD